MLVNVSALNCILDAPTVYIIVIAILWPNFSIVLFFQLFTAHCMSPFRLECFLFVFL